MERLLTTSDVARLLAVHEDTVRKLIHSRRLASVQIGRHFRVRESAVEEYVVRFERQAITADALAKPLKRRRAVVGGH